jgi:hypothetical protein
MKPKSIYPLILLGLLVFEIFNFSTTEYALNDILGNLAVIGLRWSTLLATAFCFVDFAGFARLIYVKSEHNKSVEINFLFSAWMLATGMNAILTWWCVTVAITSQYSQIPSMLNVQLLHTIPVFVALMVWMIRILIVGSLSFMQNSVNK